MKKLKLKRTQKYFFKKKESESLSPKIKITKCFSEKREFFYRDLLKNKVSDKFKNLILSNLEQKPTKSRVLQNKDCKDSILNNFYRQELNLYNSHKEDVINAVKSNKKSNPISSKIMEDYQLELENHLALNKFIKKSKRPKIILNDILSNFKNYHRTDIKNNYNIKSFFNNKENQSFFPKSHKKEKKKNISGYNKFLEKSHPSRNSNFIFKISNYDMHTKKLKDDFISENNLETSIKGDRKRETVKKTKKKNSTTIKTNNLKHKDFKLNKKLQTYHSFVVTKNFTELKFENKLSKVQTFNYLKPSSFSLINQVKELSKTQAINKHSEVQSKTVLDFNKRLNSNFNDYNCFKFVNDNLSYNNRKKNKSNNNLASNTCIIEQKKKKEKKHFEIQNLKFPNFLNNQKINNNFKPKVQQSSKKSCLKKKFFSKDFKKKPKFNFNSLFLKRKKNSKNYNSHWIYLINKLNNLSELNNEINIGFYDSLGIYDNFFFEKESNSNKEYELINNIVARIKSSIQIESKKFHF